jgi:hypothetical protein
MVMTTRTPSCDWVRMRLPLAIGPIHAAVDAKADLADRRGEKAPLDPRDRDRIARHLDDCTACRQHRAGLLDAMSALAAASSAFPIEPDAPSLWPSLERRIREHEQGLAAASSYPRNWTWTRIKKSPAQLRNRLERLREAVFETLDDYHNILPEWDFRLRPGVVLGGLLTALIGGVVILQADREFTRNRLEMTRQSGPIVSTPPRTPPPSVDRLQDRDRDRDLAENNGDRWLWHSSSGTFITSTIDQNSDDQPESSRTDLPGALAQAEIPAKPGPSSATGGTHSGTGPGAGAGLTTGSGAPSSSSARYDFDLERGTPMSPDSRDAKLAY